MSVKDEGRLHFLKSSGSVLVDEGPAHGEHPRDSEGPLHLQRQPDRHSPDHDQRALRHDPGARVRAPLEPDKPGPELQRHADDHLRHRPLRARARAGKLFGVFYRRSYAHHRADRRHPALLSGRHCSPSPRSRRPGARRRRAVAGLRGGRGPRGPGHGAPGLLRPEAPRRPHDDDAQAADRPAAVAVCRRAVTALELQLPANLGLATSGLGLATCEPAMLLEQGAAACPSDSRMGGGEATVGVRFGPEIVLEHVTLAMFAAPLSTATSISRSSPKEASRSSRGS